MKTIEHVNIFTPEHVFRMGTIEIREDRIAGVKFEHPADEGRNRGALVAAAAERNADDMLYAVPGFIDLHLHGCLGRDVCDADMSALHDIAVYQVQNGITGFAPATLTLSQEELKRALYIIKSYVNQKGGKTEPCQPTADVLGINMEGPFISREKRGAQDGRYICPAQRDMLQEFMQASGGMIKILGIAPENNDVEAVIQMTGASSAYGTDGGVSAPHISLAHTNASYEEAMSAFAYGADHVTHLCNAMPAFHHRAPGVIGAAFDACVLQGRNDLTVELICDGVHVHPAMVRSLFQMFGAEHVILISDSMRGTGLPDGIYSLGGLDVEVRGSRAALRTGNSDGTMAKADDFLSRPLAGSVTNLFDCFQTAVKQMRIPIEQVLPCVTENPAKKLSVYGERGSIEVGKAADILLLDGAFRLKQVIKAGKRVSCPDAEKSQKSY